MVNAPETKPIEALGQPSCLGRTCMKWSANGELTELDVQLVLQRLIAVDEEAVGLLE